ncbi:MAG TPA: VWA domain-containing protein, partial [Oscillospiraceae bacterium]|nr:VWA domain-containing protein [Oscillospiraceae bacterium]
DGERLTVVSLKPSSQPILYVYMLDISGSIPAAHFAAAKEAILTTCRNMGENDRLILLTFGNEVNVLLQGGESYDTVRSVLDPLEAKDRNTKFYDAMDKLIEIAYPVEDMRRIAVVISDGIDDTDAGMTQEELEALLTRCGISVNALCIDTSSEENVERFRGFMHLTGGELYLFGPDDAAEVLEEMVDRLDDGWHLVLAAEDNVADGSTRTLSIDFGGETQVATEVSLDKSTADTTPPEVLWAEYDRSAGRITIAFSEAVREADVLSHYTLRADGGKDVPLSSVSYSDTDGWRAVLTPGEALSDSSVYTLSISGLTDASQEKNPLSVTRKLYPAGTAQSASPVPAETPDADSDLFPMILLGAAVVLVVALVGLIVFLIRQKNRPAAPAKPEKAKKEAKKDPSVPREKQTARFMFTKGEKKD